jgi:hypothetical protein
MSKVRKRRSVSLNKAMHEAAKARAAARNMSLVHYVHEAIAAEMRTADIEAPPHIGAHESHNPPKTKMPDNAECKAELKRRRAMTAESVSSALRTVPRDVPRTMPIEKPPPTPSPEIVESTTPLPIAVEEGNCSWCGGGFSNAWGAANYPKRRKVDTLEGPTHLGCAEERARVRDRTAHREAECL